MSAALGALLLAHTLLLQVDADPDYRDLDPPPTTTITARCTAYSYTGSRTRTGTWPVFGTVAVDPSVIPLGSHLLIDGFDGVTFVAEDTGGGVHGAWVDIYMPSRADAIRWGNRFCTVTVL